MRLIHISPLPHLWLIDIDGTIFKHNGYFAGEDQILPGVREFWETIPPKDTIILLTARKDEVEQVTRQALKKHMLRFDHILFNLPPGERILINDSKLSGLATAVSFNISRDGGLNKLSIFEDEKL